MNTETPTFWALARSNRGSYALDLYGEVGGSKDWGDGFNEKDFVDDFRQVPANAELEISINSIGGSVLTALSIVTLLAKHEGPVTIRVNGIAASAATLITCTPRAKVVMPQGSMMMIHRLSSWATGSPDQMKSSAESAQKVEDQMVGLYVRKTGRSEEEIRAAMEKESWYSAEEAKDFGLADEVDELEEVACIAKGDAVLVNGLSVPKSFFGASADRLFVAAARRAPAAVNEEESVMDLEKLKAEHPDIVAAIRDEAIAEGRQAERERIKELEQISLPGYEALLEKAKFQSNFTAEMLAVEIVKAQKAQASGTSQSIKEDADELKDLDLGMGVEAAGSENAEAQAKLIDEFIAAGKKAYIG